MDKKWSEIGKLKKITNEIINICSLIENDNGDYTNKLIEVNVLFQPLIKEINEIKEELRTIKSSDGEPYIVVDNDEDWWNENYGKNKIPNLSIAIDLLNQIKELSENVLYKTDLGITVAQQSQVDILQSNINSLSNSLINLLKTLTWLQDVVVYQSQIENDFVDNPNNVASAQSVWNLYNMIKDFDGDCDCAYCLKQEDIGKTVASYDSVVELYNLLGKPEIHFDTTIVDNSQVEKEEDHIVINIEERAVFMPDNDVYKRVNFSEDEINKLIQISIDIHDKDINAHLPWRGKMVGETNPLSDATEEEPFIGSSERFNDYVNNSIPNHEDDYFHSIINKNNKIMEGSIITFDIEINPFEGGESDIYSVTISTDSDIDLNEYVGYTLFIYPDSEVITHSGTTKQFKDCFDTKPKDNKYLILGLNDGKIVISLNKYNLDGLYESLLNTHLGAIGNVYNRTTKFIETDFPLIIKNVNITRNSFDGNSYVTNPVFIAGSNNLCAKGNQFIIGSNNIPTDSCFVIGNPQKSDVTYIFGGLGLQEKFIRDNIFEIDQTGLIFIKTPKDLNQHYDEDNNEVLKLEYKCLQKILIDLNQRIFRTELDITRCFSGVTSLMDRVTALEQKVADLETLLDSYG